MRRRIEWHDLAWLSVAHASRAYIHEYFTKPQKLCKRPLFVAVEQSGRTSWLPFVHKLTARRPMDFACVGARRRLQKMQAVGWSERATGLEECKEADAPLQRSSAVRILRRLQVE